MNNTDRLLRAFIYASGYEIKEVGGGVSPARRKELEDNNMLFTLATEDVTDYKVTKKCDIHSSGVIGWDCMDNMEKATVLQNKINELTK